MKADAPQRLANTLQLLFNTLVIGMAADAVIGDDSCLPVIQETIVKLPRHTIELRQVAESLPNPLVREQVRGEFQKLLFRAVVGDALRLTTDHFDSAISESERDKLSWYWFAKVVRNALSHNLRLSIRETYVRKRLPITWRHRTITAAMHGAPLREILDYSDAIDLLADIRSSLPPAGMVGA
jgi:hypothetical protein